MIDKLTGWALGMLLGAFLWGVIILVIMGLVYLVSINRAWLPISFVIAAVIGLAASIAEAW